MHNWRAWWRKWFQPQQPDLLPNSRTVAMRRLLAKAEAQVVAR